MYVLYKKYIYIYICIYFVFIEYKKLKRFYSFKYNIANRQSNKQTTSNHNMATSTSRDYRSNCDVLSISSYSSDSKDAQTPNGGYGSDSEDLWMSYIVTPTVDEHEHEHKHKTYPSVDPNDPLRYFLERGEITPNEYERWKLVREELEPHQHRPQSQQSKKRNDFGPGYNSDSDDDDDSNSDVEAIIEYGTGYSVHADEYNDPFDPWNPTPDPTHDRRYTKLATDGEYMLKRLTQGRKLSDAFELKLAWERFKSSSSSSSSSSPTHQLQTLQDFWMEHALQIYEALQELSENQARVQGNPEYHTTPFETLENTFETIGRMSRCIAEEFNTPSVVAYVEEFLMMLYREIEFIALVEEHDTKMREQQKQQQ
jgi:hypothetical protein